VLGLMFAERCWSKHAKPQSAKQYLILRQFFLDNSDLPKKASFDMAYSSLAAAIYIKHMPGLFANDPRGSLNLVRTLLFSISIQSSWPRAILVG